MAAIDALPAIPATYHLEQGVVAEPFRDLHVGPLVPYRLTVSDVDVQRWARIHEESYPWRLESGAEPGAPPSILYYAAMNALAPIRTFGSTGGEVGGGLARYWTEFHAPVPLDTPLEVRGEVTDKYVRRDRGWVEWQIQVFAGSRLLQRSGRAWASGISEDESLLWPERPGSPRLPEPLPGAQELTPIVYVASQEHITDFEGGSDHGGMAQGALSFGLLCRLGTERIGSRFAVGGALDVRFIRRVTAGDELTAHAVALGPDESGRSVFRAWAENQHGETTTVGILAARL